MKICIDAGHNNSGADTGAQGALYKEQDLTFLIANELKNILEKSGVSVVMTRNSSSDNVDNTSLNASLLRRSQIANENNVDYFVSVHINAGGGVGFETYVYSKTSPAYEKAVKVQKAFASLGRRDRGVKTANFSVLRNTNAPAFLAECGFIDNAEEEKWIMANYKQIANAIASAFTEADTAKELTAAEAISILHNKGIISDPDKWYAGTWVEEDVKWLLKKTAQYVL